MARSSFNVATFNLFNLVLPNVSYYGDQQYTPEIYNRKVNWIGHQLTRLDADIVGFQEVFHEQALKDALAASDRDRTGTLVVANPTGDKPAVALASSFPLHSVKVIQDFPVSARLDLEGTEIPITGFSHPVLWAHVTLSDRVECLVVVVHLKSKRPIFPEGVDYRDPVERAKGQARALVLRAAEATALRVLLMEHLQHRDYPVIVLGDLNDSGLAVTSRLLSGEPPHKGMWQQHKKAIWDVLLYYVKDIQARQSYGDFYYTHIHNGYYESLDHILVSQEFVAQNPRRVGRVRYLAVFNDHLVDESLSDKGVEPWKSDHGQAVATIELESV